MANAEHLEKLHKGVYAWNQWRIENHIKCPDLKDADLRRTDLCEVNLSGVELNGANLGLFRALGDPVK